MEQNAVRTVRARGADIRKQDNAAKFDGCISRRVRAYSAIKLLYVDVYHKPSLALA